MVKIDGLYREISKPIKFDVFISISILTVTDSLSLEVRRET